MMFFQLPQQLIQQFFTFFDEFESICLSLIDICGVKMEELDLIVFISEFLLSNNEILLLELIFN